MIPAVLLLLWGHVSRCNIILQATRIDAKYTGTMARDWKVCYSDHEGCMRVVVQCTCVVLYSSNVVLY